MEILIIRSTKIEHLDLVLERVRRSFPYARIKILTHTHAITSMEAREDISVVPYRGKGDFSIFRIKEFRGIEVDLVVVPFNNSSGAGYLNAIIFAFGIRAKKRMSCNRNGELREMGYGYLVKRIAVGMLASIFGAVGMVVFMLPVFLMVGLYGRRGYGYQRED